MLTPESNTDHPPAGGGLLERRFAALVRASAQILWTTDADGRVIEDSPSWREFTGQTREQFFGRGWLNAIHPADRDQTAAAWLRAVEARSHYETSYRLRHHSGEWRWTLARGFPVFGDDQSIDCWVGLSDDETERRNALAALADSEIQFRELAETTPNLLWVADGRAQVTYWNPAWLKYTGLTANLDLDQAVATVVRSDHQDLARRAWSEAVEARTPFEIELALRGSHGRYEWFLVKARPTHDAVGKVVRWSGYMTNINAQRDVNSRLRQERQNRERFVSTLVHDLKNAFGTGKSAMSTLMDGTFAGEDRAALENIVRRSFDRASRMVEDLLDANNLGAGQSFPLKSTESFHLLECAREVAGALAHAAASRIELDVPPDLEVRWSFRDTVRIFENLIGNAVKYGDRARPITVEASVTAQMVCWSVHNWGNPLSEEDQSGLFDFLGRSAAALRGGEEGWGIGLTLVKGLVEAHAGTIRIESSLERGTRFIMDMPREFTIAP